MKKTISLLGALLVAQLLLAFGLSFTGPRLSARSADKPLFSLAGGDVDRITIEGPDQAKVVLAKVGGAWQLPDEGNFPADKARADALVKTLEGLKEGMPVATTSQALARFKVGDDRFERRITLAGAGKTLATLYFGTSPSMREIHARRSGQRDVYSVAFATYQAPAKAESWEDKAILQIPKKDIEAIDVAGLHIARVSVTPEAAQPEWEATGLAKGEALDTKAADKLAGLLADLRIDAVLGKNAKPDYGLDRPVLALSLVKAGGQTIDYALGKEKDGKTYTLKASTRDEYFRLPDYTASPLLDAAKRDKLLAAPEASHAPAAKLAKPAAKLAKPVAKG
ncbi:MAG: DUF4340 domain-containing protein [Betaproteobacteria bacterium]|nr:DUF4340 domain-containing protein [Betaproteobacteria bacterium]MDE2002786.1 DUF4340 domain-containing protein [Betaproteobacteria bacterium]MDE2209356.1 DUF4340 domain-containing protein [Betaproteobacteria bacterium]